MTAEILQKIWPEWKIEGKPLGKGSFGVVYKAVRRDHGVESYAAIKVISVPTDPAEVDSLRSEGLDMNATRTYLQGIVNDFVSEIQLMESLKGVQNIVSVEDYKVVEKTGEIGWDIYIRMELLTSFNAYICDKKLKEEEVIKLGCDICTALEICAKRNIIHRDIKPENIFINDFGDFKLGDFGIARKLENMTGGLSQKGTFNYMAPEVSDSSQYDARVDTYSLGIVLYRLLNGNRLPFLDTEKQLLNPNERRNAVDRRLRGEELPAPCDASPAMAELILRACAYDPNMRFASATEMKQALLSVANGTYQGIASNPDRTTSVRKAADSYDNTTSVRKAPAASNQKSAPTVNTFGSAPKKKSKMPAVIAAVLAVILLSGVGFLIVPKLLDGYDRPDSSETSDETTSEMADYSELDEEQQIAFIINDAETLAADDDFEGALSTIQRGLEISPESGELRDKAEEYTENLNTQIKRQALSEAESFANSGDYLGALQAVNQAQKSVGNDDDLADAAEIYKEKYVSSVISEADIYVSKSDFDAAINLCQSAYNAVRDDRLLDKIDLINDQKPITIDLSSLKIVDSEWDFNGNAKSKIIDTYGNTYDRPIVFDGLNDYVTYYTSGKYMTLAGFLAAHDGMEHDYTAIVTIYADDVLIYTSPEISRTTKPIEVSLDISGADTIKVVSTGNINYGDHEGAIAKLYVSTDYSIKLELTSSLDYKDKQDVASLKMIDSEWDFYGTSNSITKDTFGNVYDAPIVLDGVSDFVTYYAADKYLKLEGMIAAHDGMEYNYSAVVTIYADDVLIYTSPEISRTTKPIEVSLDISGADTIKVVSTGNINYGDHEGAIIKLSVTNNN